MLLQRLCTLLWAATAAAAAAAVAAAVSVPDRAFAEDPALSTTTTDNDEALGSSAHTPSVSAAGSLAAVAGIPIIGRLIKKFQEAREARIEEETLLRDSEDLRELGKRHVKLSCEAMLSLVFFMKTSRIHDTRLVMLVGLEQLHSEEFWTAVVETSNLAKTVAPTLSGDEWAIVRQNLETCSDRQKASNVIINFRAFVRGLNRKKDDAGAKQLPPSNGRRDGGTRKAMMSTQMRMMMMSSPDADQAPGDRARKEADRGTSSDSSPAASLSPQRLLSQAADSLKAGLLRGPPASLGGIGGAVRAPGIRFAPAPPPLIL